MRFRFGRNKNVTGSEDDPATQSSIELTTPKQQQPHQQSQPPKPNRRMVRFVESANQFHDSIFTHKSECASLWCKPSDIMVFKLQNRQNVRDLHRLEQTIGEGEADTWNKAYTAAYQVCVEATTPEDVAKGLSAQRCTVDIFTAGMEKKGIPSVAVDSVHRRRQLWKNVLYLQKNRMINDVHIRQVCRQISLPSRLYARYIALVAAAADL